MPVSKKVIEFYRKIPATVSSTHRFPRSPSKAGIGNLSLGMLHAAGMGVSKLFSGTREHMKLIDSFNPREIRRRLGLNQAEFWTRIGVTQSGGSRYESGRSMPKPVLELLRLVHVERIDLSRVKKEDFEIIDHLKSHQPDLYQSVRKAVRGKRRRPEESKH